MFTRIPVIIISLLAFAATSSLAQTIPVSNKQEPLTISYAVKVTSGKKSVAAADAYDGGSKILFLDGKKARIRLVSLMRMESIFFTNPLQADKFAILVKESGKDSYKRNFSKISWTKFNDKYQDATCTFQNDSLEVLGFTCKKATINCKDGSEITVYYTSELPALPEGYDPAFACIPGMVMQYEYAYKSASVVYQATSVSREIISPNIFRIPSRINRRLQ